MKIRKSTLSDLNTILNLYENARAFMAANGNPTQWGTTNPLPEIVENDIKQGHSYVCEENERIIAVFFYNICEEPNYVKIYEGNWINNSEYGVVHRITSDGSVKGTASFCLQWAFDQCRNLRIDTHRNNHIMRHLLKKNGFTYCGIIYIEDGTERLAFQKAK
ncbi:MAG: GNAT family N-acetyltransferase [Schaedlerella sp.]|nr:GNAT family N-acetyltransferase [Schaedlerella sp.]